MSVYAIFGLLAFWCVHNACALKRQFLRSSDVKSFCDDQAWERDWADEFDGDRLDTSSWSTIGTEGRSVTARVVGSLSETACRTAECRAENVRVADGFLYLTSRGQGSNLSTGAVTTKGHRAWKQTPGFRLCVSAVLPGVIGGGQGVWPAHWMLPDNDISEQCLDGGEMDIMEMINADGKVYNTYHWMSSFPGKPCASFAEYHKSLMAVTNMLPDWNTHFHEYAVERSADHISYAIDGRVIKMIPSGQVDSVLSSSPFFLILNTAIGGEWPGEPNAKTVLPVEHVIDYVRVSRRKV